MSYASLYHFRVEQLHPDLPGLGLRAAAVVGPACFLLGAAGGHIYQMIVAENFAPGNAGIIFYTDIGVPLVGFVLLWLQYRLGRESTSSERVSGEVVGA